MTYVKLKNLFEEQSLLNDINGILNWDMATYMPQNSRNQRVRQIQKILDYKKSIFDQIKKNELFKKINDSSLSPEDKLNLNLMKDKFEYFDIVPYEYIKKKTSLAILCEGEWRKAKLKSNFNTRTRNFKYLRNFFSINDTFFEVPKDDLKIKTAWLAFPLLIKSNKYFDRTDLQIFLEKNNIQTRTIFTGNIFQTTQ